MNTSHRENSLKDLKDVRKVGNLNSGDDETSRKKTRPLSPLHQVVKEELTTVRDERKAAFEDEHNGEDEDEEIDDEINSTQDVTVAAIPYQTKNIVPFSKPKKHSSSSSSAIANPELTRRVQVATAAAAAAAVAASNLNEQQVQSTPPSNPVATGVVRIRKFEHTFSAPPLPLTRKKEDRRPLENTLKERKKKNVEAGVEDNISTQTVKHEEEDDDENSNSEDGDEGQTEEHTNSSSDSNPRIESSSSSKSTSSSSSSSSSPVSTKDTFYPSRISEGRPIIGLGVIRRHPPTSFTAASTGVATRSSSSSTATRIFLKHNASKNETPPQLRRESFCGLVLRICFFLTVMPLSIVYMWQYYYTYRSKQAVSDLHLSYAQQQQQQQEMYRGTGHPSWPHDDDDDEEEEEDEGSSTHQYDGQDTKMKKKIKKTGLLVSGGGASKKTKYSGSGVMSVKSSKAKTSQQLPSEEEQTHEQQQQQQQQTEQTSSAHVISDSNAVYTTSYCELHAADPVCATAGVNIQDSASADQIQDHHHHQQQQQHTPAFSSHSKNILLAPNCRLIVVDDQSSSSIYNIASHYSESTTATMNAAARKIFTRGQLLTHSNSAIQALVHHTQICNSDPKTNNVPFSSIIPPNLPRSSLSRPGWGAAHVPLPPSWALTQASSSNMAPHREADRLMCGDGAGNSYPLFELTNDILSGLDPTFGFTAKSIGVMYGPQPQEHQPPLKPEEALSKELLMVTATRITRNSRRSDDVSERNREKKTGHHAASTQTFERNDEDDENVQAEDENNDDDGDSANSDFSHTRTTSSFVPPPPSLAHPAASTRMPPSASIRADPYRQHQVKQAMIHAWTAYQTYAWGFDSLKPVSKTGTNDFGGLSISIVDSLDTLLIMGLRQEYDRGVEHIIKNLFLVHQEDVNVFELTIRVLGGLLSAWELDHRRDPRLLEKAVHVADALSFAFESPTGIPYGTLGLKSRRKFNPSWVAGSTIAEVGTLFLEWEHLSHATANPKYALLVRKAAAHLLAAEITTDSLWPTYVHPETGEWASTGVTLGARGDSLYEYLLKSYLLAGGTRDTRTWATQQQQQHEQQGNAEKQVWKYEITGIVGNDALLHPQSTHVNVSVPQEWHSVITTSMYAPLPSSKAGRAWKSAAGGTVPHEMDANKPQDTMWVPSSTSSSSSSSVASDDGGANDMLNAFVVSRGGSVLSAYADAMAEYEVRSHSLLKRAVPGYEGGMLPSTTGSNTNGGKKRSTKNKNKNKNNQPPSFRPVISLPPFHPAAHISPHNSPVTYASEAAWFTSMYGAHLRSAAGIEHQLVRVTAPGALVGSIGGGAYTYLMERNGEAVVREAGGSSGGAATSPSFSYDGKVDHLVCFTPGYYALSSTVAPTAGLRARHLSLARRLMRTCMRMYSSTQTGLSPEISRIADTSDGPTPDNNARHSLLRPETVESLFVLYRVTGDILYREWGAQILASIEKYAKIPSGGYSSIRDVTVTPTSHSDHQESFFLAETLKYLYLLFSDGDMLPLDEWVFNTEAHPLPVWVTKKIVG